MTRDEWNATTGAGTEVIDELEWVMFSAKQSIAATKLDQKKLTFKMIDVWLNQIADCRVALAALYTAMENAK